MKTTKVTPWLIEASRPFLDTADDNKNATSVREYLFVEVSTDEGVTGWGKVTAQKTRARPICAGLRHVSELTPAHRNDLEQDFQGDLHGVTGLTPQT